MEQQGIRAIEAEAVNLEQEDSNSLSADIVLRKRDVNEACAWSNMTTLGKTVLLGLLTQNHIERATFLGLRSSPLTRATRVEERLAKKFPNTEESFYNKGFVNLMVMGGNLEVYYKIKKIAQLGKLLDIFLERAGQGANTTRFHFDGDRVKPTDTPDALELVDGDVIEAYYEQIG